MAFGRLKKHILMIVTLVMAMGDVSAGARAEVLNDSVSISVKVPRSFFVHVIDDSSTTSDFDFTLTDGCGDDGTQPCIEGNGYIDFAIYGNADERTRVSIAPPADKTVTRSGVDFGVFDYVSGFVPDAPPIYYFPLFAKWRISNAVYQSGVYPDTFDVGGNRYRNFEVVSPAETTMQTFIDWNPTRTRNARLHNRSYEIYRLWVQPLFDDDDPIESFADIAPGEYTAEVVISIIPPT